MPGQDWPRTIYFQLDLTSVLQLSRRSVESNTTTMVRAVGSGRCAAGLSRVVLLQACMATFVEGSFVYYTSHFHGARPRMLRAGLGFAMEIADDRRATSEVGKRMVENSPAIEAASSLGWTIQPMTDALGAEVMPPSPSNTLVVP